MVHVDGEGLSSDEIASLAQIRGISFDTAVGMLKAGGFVRYNLLINSSNTQLSAKAKAWADSHGYEVSPASGNGFFH